MKIQAEPSPKTIEVSGKSNPVIRNEPLVIPTNEQTEQSDFKFISDKTFAEAIAKANKIMVNHNTRAEFSIHEQTKTILVKIIDTESNQVLKEYPSEKILDMIAKIWELAGLFVDERR